MKTQSDGQGWGKKTKENSCKEVGKEKKSCRRKV